MGAGRVHARNLSKSSIGWGQARTPDILTYVTEMPKNCWRGGH